MLRFRLRLLTYPRSQFLHTNRGICHRLRAFPRSRSLDRPGPLARRGSLPGRRSSCRRASRRITSGSSLRPTQRPPSGLRSPLPAPTLLRRLSPRGQEGFTSSNATLRCVLPSLPRRNQLRLSASVLPPPMLPSPLLEWLGFRTLLHGACSTFDACGPQRRFPALQPSLSGGTTPCFRHSNASPQLHGSLAVTVSRFPLAGSHRLSSGHAENENENEGATVGVGGVDTRE
jgi:hypothetical protein